MCLKNKKIFMDLKGTINEMKRLLGMEGFQTPESEKPEGETPDVEGFQIPEGETPEGETPDVTIEKRVSELESQLSELMQVINKMIENTEMKQHEFSSKIEKFEMKQQEFSSKIENTEMKQQDFSSKIEKFEKLELDTPAFKSKEKLKHEEMNEFQKFMYSRKKNN